jgi:hypothetical protein
VIGYARLRLWGIFSKGNSGLGLGVK